MERVNKMFKDRYDILDQLMMLIEVSKKYDDKDRNSILFDLQTIVDGVLADIDEEAFAYENYQDVMVVTNG